MECPCCNGTGEIKTPEHLREVIRSNNLKGGMLGALIDSYPRTVSRDYLIEHLWDYGQNEPENAHKTVQVMRCHINKSIAPLGWTISSSLGSNGYKLVSEGSQNANTRQHH